MSETVECYRCGKRVRLRKDDTYPAHGWTRMGSRFECEYSGRRHHRHSGSFRIIERNPDLWLCECLCGEAFTGDTYEAVEQNWKQHIAAVEVPA